MSFDVGFIIGADDTAFKQTLAASESHTSRVAGRIEQTIRAKTEGVQKLVGRAQSLIGTFAAATGIVGGIGAAIFGVVTLLDQWSKAAGVAADKARAEALEREKIARSLREQIELTRAQAGLGGDAERLSLVQGFGRETQDLDLTGRASADAATRQRFMDNLALFEARGVILEQRLQQLATQRAKRLGDLVANQDIERADLLGQVTEAQILREGVMHEQRRRAIAEAAGQDESLKARLYAAEDESLKARLYAAEDERHKTRIQQIRDEQDARDKAAQEEAAQQARRARDLAQNAAELAEQLDIERLRLVGQKEASDEAQRRLETERNLRRIRDLEGIDESTRQQLIEAERRNAQLRGADAVGASAGLLAQRVVSGFIGARAVAERVLGTDAAGPAEKLNKSVDKIGTMLSRIERQFLDLAGPVRVVIA